MKKGVANKTDEDQAADLDRASEGIRKFFQEVVSDPLETSISQKLKGIESHVRGVSDVNSKAIEIYKFLEGEMLEKLNEAESQLKSVQGQMRLQGEGQPQTMRGHLIHEIAQTRASLEKMMGKLAVEHSGDHQACIEHIGACRQETLQAHDILAAELARSEAARSVEHQALLDVSNSAHQGAGELFVSVCKSMSDQISAELADRFRACEKRILIVTILASVGVALNAALIIILLNHLK